MKAVHAIAEHAAAEEQYYVMALAQESTQHLQITTAHAALVEEQYNVMALVAFPLLRIMANHADYAEQ